MLTNHKVKTDSTPSLPEEYKQSDRKESSGKRTKIVSKAQIVTVGEVIGSGDSQIIHDALSPGLAEKAFEDLKSEIEWKKMYHRGGEVPRLVAVQGDVGDDGEVPIYRHPADESPPLRPFTRTLEKIRLEVQNILSQPFNHALVQLYRSGSDNISEHSDKVGKHCS